jgi:alpha-methylacyl-CoA racemase
MSLLSGFEVLEIEGIGPAPLAGRMLADMGADVTVVVRPGDVQHPSSAAANRLRRGKSVLELDLKLESSVERVLSLIERADALIESFRPGVMERLGLGPADCAKRNPRLVYARLTGWGQAGPLSQAAGHDLNYVAVAGVLSLFPRRDELPAVPPTVIGDAAGAQGLVTGILGGLLAVKTRGRGCIVDCAISDVAASLAALALALREKGWLDSPEPCLFQDAPFYAVYKCADGKYLSVGAIEPRFYAALIAVLGWRDVDLSQQLNQELWPELRRRFRDTFATQPRDYWCERFGHSDSCVAPVLSLDEAAEHQHMLARRVFQMKEGKAVDVAVAPRFTDLP